jgi:hypothetical protein
MSTSADLFNSAARDGGSYNLISLLNDLGVLDQRDSATLGQFAFERDRFAARIGELVVHRFVFADDEIGFAVFNNADRAAVLDALRAAGLTMLRADCVVIDIAHHVHDFAGHALFTRGV